MAEYRITLRTSDAEHQIECDGDDPILDCAEDQGISDLPWGCRAGVCGSCVSRLVSGSVDQEEQSAIDDEHVAEGYIVLCVGYPTSDCVIETGQRKQI